MSHQAFILPLPKSNGSASSEDHEIDPQIAAELAAMRQALAKLYARQISWEGFLSSVDVTSPTLRTAATKEGDTMLHIAALQGRKDIFDQFSSDIMWRWKRNMYGLTPIEIAQFLHRKELYSPRNPSFYAQPGIQVEESGHTPFLSALEYIHHPIFEGGPDLLYKILSRSQKAKIEDQIPPEKIWMGIYFDKEVQEGLHPPVAIRFIDREVGWGVFAAARIPSCAYVGEYTGVVSERKRRHLDGKTYCVRYTVWEMGRKNFVIDAEQKGNFTRFINHSAKPNLSLQSIYWRGIPRMIFVALQEIAEGSQLTFDYGTFFWKECHQTPKLF